ncbi:MAG: GNAT family N-acetyltransferase [Novosphingobium sp.]
MSFALLAASAAHFEQLCAGLAPEPGIELPSTPLAQDGVLPMLAGLAAGIRGAFDPCAWLVLDGKRLVGLISLTAAPTIGTITIGYGIAPSEQGRGAATGAVAALLDWARSDERVWRIEAETGTANVPSQRVLERNGFAQVGERTVAEDGALFCWRIAW